MYTTPHGYIHAEFLFQNSPSVFNSVEDYVILKTTDRLKHNTCVLPEFDLHFLITASCKALSDYES